MFLDVLEHIEDPRLFLSRHSECFPRAEHVLLTLPARAELWSNYDEYFGHYRRYDLKKAEKMLEGTAFYPVDSGYFFHLLYLPVRLLSLVGVNRGTWVTPPKPGLTQWIHSLAARFFIRERQILPDNLPGTSLFLLASVK